MKIDLSKLISQNETVAVALSGGRDSMALLYYMLSYAKKFHINVIALNVEHGIRGEESLSDTKFVKDYCEMINIPLLTYSVDAIKKAEDDKLSLEQAARILRYQCFYDALDLKKCDKIATAHHLDDNVESILFNLFRGTGVKGAVGIEKDYNGKIIRPFLGVEKAEIEKYVKENSIPFVTDSTNACCDYTRNALRLKVIPEIKKLFPKMQDSILRFTEILKEDNDYLSLESKKILTLLEGKAEISIPCHYALFSRATITALKHLGIEKDYEKVHIDEVYALIEKQNGNSINLPKGVIAIKEYDKIVFFKASPSEKTQIPFSIGELEFLGKTLKVSEVVSPNLKSGFFLDLEKIPNGAVIRTKKVGDTFTKFGGGTKSLGDYLTDKKIPQRERDLLPIITSGNEVLAIFGIAVSNKVKVDDTTKTIIQITIDD